MTADKLSEAYFTASGRLMPEKPTPAQPKPPRIPTDPALLAMMQDLDEAIAAGRIDPATGAICAHTPFCGKDGRGCVCRARTK